MLLIVLLIAGLYLWVILSSLYKIGKNLGDPNPGLAYWCWLPLVMPYYICRLGRIEGLKFFMVMVISTIIVLGGIYNFAEQISVENKIIETNLELRQLRAVVDRSDYSDSREGLTKYYAAVREVEDSPEYRQIVAEQNEIVKGSWIQGLISLASIGVGLYLISVLIMVTGASFSTLFYLFVPIAGIILFYNALALASENASSDLESRYNSLDQQERQFCDQIFEVLQGHKPLNEEQIVSYMRQQGLIPKRALEVLEVAKLAHANVS